MGADCTRIGLFGDCSPATVDIRTDLHPEFDCTGTSQHCVADNATSSSSITLQVDIGPVDPSVLNCSTCTNATSCLVDETSLPQVPDCPTPVSTTTTTTTTTSTTTTTTTTTTNAPNVFEMSEWTAQSPVQNATTGTGQFANAAIGITYITQANGASGTGLNTAQTFKFGGSFTPSWNTIQGVESVMTTLNPQHQDNPADGGAMGVDFTSTQVLPFTNQITFTNTVPHGTIWFLACFCDFNSVFDFSTSGNGIAIAEFFSSTRPDGNPMLVQNGFLIEPNTTPLDDSYRGDNVQDSFYVKLTGLFDSTHPLSINEWWINKSSVNSAALNWASVTFTLIIQD